MDVDIAPRSERQFGFYWVAVVPVFAQYWQVSPGAAHARLKDLANYGRSTMILSRTGWTDYLTRLKEMAARCGVIWPQPKGDHDYE